MNKKKREEAKLLKAKQQEELKEKLLNILQSKQCLTYEEIGRELGMHQQKVYYLMKQFNLQITYDLAKLVLLNSKKDELQEKKKAEEIEKEKIKALEELEEKRKIKAMIDECAKNGHLSYEELSLSLNTTRQICERRVNLLKLKNHYNKRKIELKDKKMKEKK